MARVVRLLIGCLCLSVIIAAGCEEFRDDVALDDGGSSAVPSSSSPGSSSSSQTPSGVACGPYTVAIVDGYSYYDKDLVVYGLWSDGSDYRDTFVSGTSFTQPGQSRPTGWTETISTTVNGVFLGTHTLRFQNVRYSPVSFTLTIDGAYTCNYP